MWSKVITYNHMWQQVPHYGCVNYLRMRKPFSVSSWYLGTYFGMFFGCRSMVCIDWSRSDGIFLEGMSSWSVVVFGLSSQMVVWFVTPFWPFIGLSMNLTDEKVYYFKIYVKSYTSFMIILILSVFINWNYMFMIWPSFWRMG